MCTLLAISLRAGSPVERERAMQAMQNYMRALLAAYDHSAKELDDAVDVPKTT